MNTFTKFRTITSLAAALTAAVAIAGCGDNKNGATDDTTPTPTSTPVATTGTIAATWAYTGAQAPSKVKILLIDASASGLTCTTLPFTPPTAIQTLPNLPVS